MRYEACSDIHLKSIDPSFSYWINSPALTLIQKFTEDIAPDHAHSELQAQIKNGEKLVHSDENLSGLLYSMVPRYFKDDTCSIFLLLIQKGSV